MAAKLSKGRKKPITGAELVSQLANDPEYQARIKIQEQERVAKEAAIRKEEAKLVAELQEVGIKINYVSDFVGTSKKYKAAIPILIRHLDESYSSDTIEFIVRALTVREARGLAAPRLIRLFEEVEDENLRWVIGNAIGYTAEEEQQVAVQRLLRDVSYGAARGGLIEAVARLQGEAAIPLIEQLLDDEHQLVFAEAIRWLGKLGACRSAAAIERFLKHEDSWVRGHARKALRNLRA